MFSTVLFPAPLGPSTPVIPASSAHDTSLTATTLPYQRDTFRNSIRACFAGDAGPSGVKGWIASETAVMLRSSGSASKKSSYLPRRRQESRRGTLHQANPLGRLLIVALPRR